MRLLVARVQKPCVLRERCQHRERCQEKDVNIENMRFNGMDGTNTMSGEISGLQQRFRHITPHTKYMNCGNHILAIVFVHLLDQYEILKAVDTSLISVWKLMKYSSLKSAV